ncbi:MAG TPA: radical SAM protein [Bacteroidetes bacterium]|nr:radical SAM protein [Bacteroidota bacterium]
MRVLLINPPAKNYYGELGLNLLPLGLGYLAAVLQREGHSVDAIDLQVQPIPVEDIPFSRYDLVGISSDTPRFNRAVEIGRAARARGVPVVMGGYHPTFLDAEPFEREAADFVIRGEGEYSLLRLVEVLEKGSDLGQVRGLTYRENGTLRRNPPAYLIENLDELPFPARELFPKTGYLSTFDGRPMATLVTSRGCPYDCYFCAATRFAGVRWRTRDLSNVFDELEMLQRQGYSSFLFVDDNFTLSYRRTMDFCSEVFARHWDIRWWCFSRVDVLVKHPDMVRQMALAGASSVFLGLESGNQATLDHYQKKITVEQQREAVRLLKRHGIRVYGSFIIGEMHETPKMIRQTIRFARRLKPETCQFSLLTPYPGSRLFQQLDSLKQLITKNWDLYDGAHLVFKNPNISAKELQRLLRQAYLKFYLRASNIPAVVIEFLKDPVEFREIVRQIKAGVDIFRRLKTA